ncbi:hypothetical protein QVD17_02553 [Tagetes erecta]|uniref:Uncharacterized protein n=1 Tax=Tagetes erecta TaxID=13708 RepID=A0AAD8P998_TARER|nr:hypothetical protein QVD17_02553 [Tagetes erecta]
MATMKLALISLTLFVLLEAYNARHLHDVSIKGSFNNKQPIFQATIIQMVTVKEQLLLPPSPPKLAPSKGQETYGRVSSSPPPPNAAPSRGQATYGRVDPLTPPSPNPNDSQGHGMYGRVDPSAPAPPKPADPTRPLLGDGGSAFTGLSTLLIDQLSFYVTRLIKYWG